MLPDNFDWASVSEDELQKMWKHFGSKTSAGTFQVDTVVPSGKTVVADIYEAGPGEFVFSRVTPTIKSTPSGSRQVEIAVDSSVISISGNQRKLFSNFSNKQNINSGSVKTLVDLADDGNYKINLKPEIKNSGTEVRIQASGTYERR